MQLPCRGKSRQQFRRTVRINSASSDPPLCNNQLPLPFTQCNQIFKLSNSLTTSASSLRKVTSLSSSRLLLSSSIIFNKTMFLRTSRFFVKMVLSKLLASKFSSRRPSRIYFLDRLLKISFKLAGV